MNIFYAQLGMLKRSFHVVDEMNLYVIDVEGKLTVSAPDAIQRGSLKIIRKTSHLQEYFTREKYLLLSVSQRGFKVPTYTSRFIIELGGEEKIRINSFAPVAPKDWLFFEGVGRIVYEEEAIKIGIDFISDIKKGTPPRKVERQLTQIRDKRPPERRSIEITKGVAL